MFACVARARPSSQHRKIMRKHGFLWVVSHSRVFHAHRKGQGNSRQRRLGIKWKMPRKPKAREAKNIVPKSAFWKTFLDPQNRPRRCLLGIRRRLGQASGSQKRPEARKKTPGPAQERPKSAKKRISTDLAKKLDPGRHQRGPDWRHARGP